MGGILGKVTDAIGLTNHAAEEKAAKQAGFANAQAYALTKEQVALMKEQLEFQKDQYEDWKDIYGDLQENLGEYYKNLDADDIVAMGLTQQQRSFQEAVKQIETEAAQRGISGAVVDSEIMRGQFANAEARATIRASAPDIVEQKKLGFLGLGMGQGTQMLGAINQAGANANQAYSTGVISRTNMASNFLGQQTDLAKANMDAMANVVGGVTSYGINKGYF